MSLSWIDCQIPESDDNVEGNRKSFILFFIIQPLLTLGQFLLISISLLGT